MATDDAGDDPDGWEYAIIREGMGTVGQMVRDTRHEAVGLAAIMGRYVDDEFHVEARPAFESVGPMTDDALWRARITRVDPDEDEDQHVGWTLLYEARSFAHDAAFRYMLVGHLDGVRVSSHPWYGEDYRQVGVFHGSGDDTYPIYLGFDEDGEPLEHDANALAHRQHVNRRLYSTMDELEERDADTDADAGPEASSP